MYPGRTAHDNMVDLSGPFMVTVCKPTKRILIPSIKKDLGYMNSSNSSKETARDNIDIFWVTKNNPTVGIS